ncbi:MAG: hypothetical protein Q9217_006852 [Psora testacea]
MDFSPSKRRKTSLTASIPISASNKKQPLNAQDGGRASTERSSYMSPTKASLSRFNPDLLPRSASVEPRKLVDGGNPAGARRAKTADHVMSSANGNGTNVMRSGNAFSHIRNAEEGDTSPFTHNTPSKLPRPSTKGNTANQPSHAAAPTTPTQKILVEASAATALNQSGEPSLPSTPSQLGLEPPPEKAKGLLFYTPSKRPSGKDRSTKKPSPLKPGNPSQFTAPTRDLGSELGRRIFIDSAPKRPPSPKEVESAILRTALRQLEIRLKILQEDLTCGSLLFKWHEDDAKWRKRIARQKKELGKEATEIQKLRVDSGNVDVTDASSNDQSQIETVTQRLAGFLPFSRRKFTLATKPLRNTIQGAEEVANGTNLFTVKILNSTILSLMLDNCLSVRQDVVISTPEHARLARLQMSVDPTSQVVSGVRVLEMIDWAVAELSPWLANEAGGKTTISIGKAIGRYLEVSGIRARCWSRCKNDFSAMEKATVDNASSLRDNQFPSYGDSLLQLARSSAKLAVRWYISFSDCGDIESKVFSETTLPNTWKQLAGGHELSRIDEAFDRLARERGVTKAIHVIADILFPP